MKNTKVAIVYDFDKTLSTDDMQAFGFIQGLDMEVDDFWNECAKFTKGQNCENILTYMYLMVKFSKEKNKPITREYLRSCGEKVKFFEGVTTWFDRINQFGKEQGVEVEHYVISSGLQDIIEGTEIADKFKKIYACTFAYENCVPVWPSLCLNYTNKTQFLYRINKGCLDILDRTVNEELAHEKRAIPFSNIIYIGDSETDIPCMRLIYKYGGTAVGLYQPGTKNEAYLRDLLKRNRISFVAKANYNENDELDTVIKAVIKNVKSKSDLEEINHKQKD